MIAELIRALRGPIGVALLATAALAGCGGTAAPTATAVLVVECAVADAALWVDERFVADVADLRGGVRLPAGRHRIEVRHPGHHAHLAELELRAGERRIVAIVLAERLD
jgi:hypothetical protein